MNKIAKTGVSNRAKLPFNVLGRSKEYKIEENTGGLAALAFTH